MHLLTTIAYLIRNPIANFVKILIYTKISQKNRANELGNAHPRSQPKVFHPQSRSFWHHTKVLNSTVKLPIIRNYINNPQCFNIYITGKIIPTILMQYVNWVNHRPVEQINMLVIQLHIAKYSLCIKLLIQYYKTCPIVWRWIFFANLLLGFDESTMHLHTVEPVVVKKLH